MAGRGVKRHLLDTCAFLDLAGGRWSRAEARAALRHSPDAGVLCLSIWEIARKARLGKLQLPCPPSGILDFAQAVCERHGIRLLPLTPEICHEAELLPLLHHDPFDRMIIAAARLMPAVIFTTDPQFSGYPVDVMAHR
jgi:PIN domain nuclease of toxin-antitoxin system